MSSCGFWHLLPFLLPTHLGPSSSPRPADPSTVGCRDHAAKAGTRFASVVHTPRPPTVPGLQKAMQQFGSQPAAPLCFVCQNTNFSTLLSFPFECECLGGRETSPLTSTGPIIPSFFSRPSSLACVTSPAPLGMSHYTLVNTRGTFFKASHPVLPWPRGGEFSKLPWFCRPAIDTAFSLCFFGAVFGALCIATDFQSG